MLRQDTASYKQDHQGNPLNRLLIWQFSGFQCSGRIRPRTNKTIKAGPRLTDRKAAAAMARLLVHAKGLNSRPSCASSAKIGKNETVMTSKLKNRAGPTSTAASIMA